MKTTLGPNLKTNKHRCYVEIDTAALTHNVERIRQFVPNSNIMAVIKADAYGHGMELVANHLCDLVDEFAVTSIEDVQRLHSVGIKKPLTLLSAQFTSSDLEWFAENRIRPVIYDYEQLDALKSIAPDTELDSWLKVDTGMGRLGFSADELPRVRDSLNQISGVRSVSLMTHLANADQPNLPLNDIQFSEFDSVIESAKGLDQSYQDISVLNSAGVIAFGDQARDYVRPGILLYGISPQIGLSSFKLNLKPVMQFKSSVISVRSMPAGTSIGYSGTYTLDHDSRIAYIACGYGDGYPRHAPSGTSVSVNGFLVPLVGRVSMDMLVVDIGELPVQVGDAVTLWGEENPIEDVAEAAGTIPYELTCSVTPRVVRLTI